MHEGEAKLVSMERAMNFMLWRFERTYARCEKDWAAGSTDVTLTLRMNK